MNKIPYIHLHVYSNSFGRVCCPRPMSGDRIRAGQGRAGQNLYHRDDGLLDLYIVYVILIWAAPIPADRWHYSLWP